MDATLCFVLPASMLQTVLETIEAKSAENPQGSYIFALMASITSDEGGELHVSATSGTVLNQREEEEDENEQEPLHLRATMLSDVLVPNSEEQSHHA